MEEIFVLIIITLITDCACFYQRITVLYYIIIIILYLHNTPMWVNTSTNKQNIENIENYNLMNYTYQTFFESHRSVTQKLDFFR